MARVAVEFTEDRVVLRQSHNGGRCGGVTRLTVSAQFWYEYHGEEEMLYYFERKYGRVLAESLRATFKDYPKWPSSRA